MHAIADLLGAVRLSGALFVDARFTAPWCVTAEITAEDCRPWVDQPRQVIGFHVVTEGAALVGLPGRALISVREGEIVLFPQSLGHLLASRAGLRPVHAGRLLRNDAARGMASIDHGGGGAVTRLVCGFLASAERFNPLIAALPPMLVLDLRATAAQGWIEASVRFAAAELAAGRAASGGVLPRLAETLLVEAVRHHLATSDETEAGWLRAARDPQVGRALALLHADIQVDRPVDELARAAAISRSAFVARFTALVGQPPIRYLTRLRLAAAQRALREPGRSVAQVAFAVGYDSEEAFSRAFKRAYAVSPARWREEQAAA
jgi:AraC-like DNA-binding protein